MSAETLQSTRGDTCHYTLRFESGLIDDRSPRNLLRDFPRIFPPLYVNMVAAGEVSGALPQILLRLVRHLMQAIYPVFLARKAGVRCHCRNLPPAEILGVFE